MKNKKTEMQHFRLTTSEKKRLTDKANKLGFRTVSDYIRFVGLNARISVTIPKDKKKKKEQKKGA